MASRIGEDHMIAPEEFVRKLNTEWNRGTMIGTLTAEAEIVHRGPTTLVVEVTVLDDERRLIAKLVATQLAPPATASPGRPGG